MTGWVRRPLAQLASRISDGSHNPPKGVEMSEFMMLSSKNIFDDQLSFDAPRYLSAADFKAEDRRTSVAAGDVLLTIVGTIGRTAVVPADAPAFTLQRSVAVIRPDSSVVDSRFLMYALMSGSEALNAQARGVAQKGIYLEALREFGIDHPPLPEQRRIVAILDEAFEGIATAKANAEKNLQNARELFESKLSALLGQDVADWPRKTLREVSIDFGRGKSRHRPRNDPKLYGGPYPFIQTGDVRGAEHLITEYTQTYSEDGLAQSKLWPRGTLCITIAANIAETGVLDFGACFPDSVIGVVVDESQTSGKYLEYMLHTVKADLKAKGKGSAQDNINLGTFENERFPFPNLGIQAHVVGLLDHLSFELQRLEELYELKLNALNQLKKSLLHQAFTGQLGNATVPVDDRWAA